MKKREGEARTRVDKVAGATNRNKRRYCGKEFTKKNRNEKSVPYETRHDWKRE